MNANTFKNVTGGTLRGQIAPLVLAATTETALVVNTNAGTTTLFMTAPTGAGIAGADSPLSPDINPAKLVSGGRLYGPPFGSSRPVFSSTSFDFGKPFKLRLVGTGSAAANAGNTLTIKFYQGTSATLGSDTALVTPISAVATATAANLNFEIEVTCFWDSTSGYLSCYYTKNLVYNGTQTSTAQTAGAVITGITSVANLSFLVSVAWGNAVGGTIAISEFSMDQV